MEIVHTIKKYKMIYYGKRDDESKEIAKIIFYNAQNQLLGWIVFFKEGQIVPDNTQRTNTDPIRVYLKASASQMPGVVDMLRNEKPCYVRYKSPKLAFIFTGQEPIGEEETE